MQSIFRKWETVLYRDLSDTEKKGRRFFVFRYTQVFIYLFIYFFCYKSIVDVSVSEVSDMRGWVCFMSSKLQDCLLLPLDKTKHCMSGVTNDHCVLMLYSSHARSGEWVSGYTSFGMSVVAWSSYNSRSNCHLFCHFTSRLVPHGLRSSRQPLNRVIVERVWPRHWLTLFYNFTFPVNTNQWAEMWLGSSTDTTQPSCMIGTSGIFVNFSFIHSFVRSFIHSFVRSFIHSFIRSFIRSFVRSFIRSFIHSFVPSFVRSFIHSFIPSFLHSFIRSFVHSFIHSFVRLFVPSFIHSFVRSFIHSFIPSFLHSFVRLFVRSFIHSFARLFILSFIHSFIHSFNHSFVN